MAAGFDKYVRWSVGKKAIVWVVAALLLSTAYYFLGFKPKVDEIRAIKAKSAKLSEQIQQKQAVAANLEEVKKAVAQMDSLLTEALKKLPSKEEIPALLKTVSDLAVSSNLQSTLFKPLKVKPIGFYAEIPLQMHENGMFYELANFFDKVSRLPRIVTVEKITIAQKGYDKDNNPRLSASFTATTFKYLPPEERPKKKKKKKKGRK